MPCLVAEFIPHPCHCLPSGGSASKNQIKVTINCIGLARPKINADNNVTLPAVWSVWWSVGSWLHSYIPTSRSRHCGQYYGPGTKPLTTSLGNKRFLLSLDTLNLTFVNIVNMHGSRNHWVSFPYYCLLMNSWHWTNTGWPSKVREDASHIWQPTADHWLVDTGLDMSSRWSRGRVRLC